MLLGRDAHASISSLFSSRVSHPRRHCPSSDNSAHLKATMATTYSSWHRPADDNRDPQPPSYSLCEVKDLPATQPEYSSNPASTSTLPPSSDLSPPQPSLLHLWLSQLSSVLAQPAESTPPKQALQAFRRSHPRTNHITKPAGRKLLRDPSKSRNHSKSFSHLLR